MRQAIPLIRLKQYQLVVKLDKHSIDIYLYILINPLKQVTMKRNDFEGPYSILKELIILQLVSTKENKTKTLDQIIYAFICYMDTGSNQYLDEIMYAMVDCEHHINLPSMLIQHIEDYMESMLIEHEGNVELGTL